VIKRSHAPRSGGVVPASTLCAPPAPPRDATRWLPFSAVSLGDAGSARPSDRFDDSGDPAYLTGFARIPVPDSLAEFSYEVVLSPSPHSDEPEFVMTAGTVSALRPDNEVRVGFGGLLPSYLEAAEYTLGLVLSELQPAELKPLEFRVDFAPKLVVASRTPAVKPIERARKRSSTCEIAARPRLSAM
jgi:hypothetical protein